MTAISRWSWQHTFCFFRGPSPQARTRSQESGPRVLHISLIPVFMQRVSMTAASALRLVTSFPSCSLMCVLESQTTHLRSSMSSTVHKVTPSFTPAFLFHPRCIPSWHEKTVIHKDKAAQKSCICGEFGPVVVKISSFRATIT